MRRIFLVITLAVLNASGASRAEAVEFRDGDRVVLIGSTLIERSQRYGYLEAELTAALAAQGKTVTFRNLGWSGDTVWAESRGIFDPPAEGYKRMIAQVRELNPTMIVLNYGANEAFAGESGLQPFIKQYEQLIDDLKADGVRFVLVTPIDHLPFSDRHPDPRDYNEKLAVYRQAIRELAERRQFDFIDLGGDLGEKPPLGTPEAPVALLSHEMTDTGVHLNAYGYKLLAPVFCAAILGPETTAVGELKGDGTVVRQDGLKISDVDDKPNALSFTVQTSRVLPLGEVTPTAVLKITGLTPGRYRLIENDETLLAVTDKQLADGIPLYPLDIERYETLRDAITEKNMLYFHRWRPQNVTYLFLFRKHEQGNNAKEIPQFDPLIEAEEKRIAELSKSVPHRLTLSPAE